MVKYSKEEKRKKQERVRSAEEESKRLIGLNFGSDTEMFARKETGISLGADMARINIPRNFSLASPYQDWKISFYPDEKEAGFSLGYFTLNCATEELTHYIELKNFSQELVKVLLEQPEIRRFADAIKEGMRALLNKFNEDFDKYLQTLSQEKRELAPILVSKETKIVRLSRASAGTLNILNRFRWILPFEVVVGKSSIDEAKEILEIALATK